MTRLTPLLTSLKTLNITYQTPQETLLGTPETLPTTEPATPQVSYTIASGDLPSLNIPIYSNKWIGVVFAAGKFVTAGTLSYRTKKNGGSIATGTLAVAANTYYTLSNFFFDVLPGDVLEIALWSNQADSNYDYKAMQCQITRVIPFKPTKILNPCNIEVSGLPTLTLGNPKIAYYGYYHWLNCDIMSLVEGVNRSFYSLCEGDTYGIYRARKGDADVSIDKRTNATYRPYYAQNKMLQKLTYRGLMVS